MEYKNVFTRGEFNDCERKKITESLYKTEEKMRYVFNRIKPRAISPISWRTTNTLIFQTQVFFISFFSADVTAIAVALLRSACSVRVSDNGVLSQV